MSFCECWSFGITTPFTPHSVFPPHHLRHYQKLASSIPLPIKSPHPQGTHDQNSTILIRSSQQFFCHLGCVMLLHWQLNGARSHRGPSKWLPLDFYDCSRLNSLNPSVKDTISNLERGHKHEKLSNKKLSELFFQQLTGTYDLSSMLNNNDNQHE
ncbi:hypothetical protein VP01_7868g1 [Puccinia sorghi]|uniref:Uncharacterized protein n=1 Tax=Puccinia sorghi TaxID=27349 RepID=A0A0L6UD22_9BASI|nr:hypothetical protein VP01_7868g1 [Puccinia sorghi]